MDRLDVGQQGHVTDASHVFVGAFLTVQVLMKSPGADIQDRTLYRDRPVPAVLLNKGVLHRDSLAKYAAAFFKISRSSFTRDNSVRRRLISICSALTIGVAE